VTDHLSRAAAFIESHASDPQELFITEFDATVIGAGPAGALAALLLARAGVRTLLLDKASFPRHKVCGCCLSANALQVLDRCGLGGLVEESGGVLLEALTVISGSQSINFPLPNSRSISRQLFDSLLISRAIEAGAVFVPGVAGHIQRHEIAQSQVTLLEAKSADSLRVSLSGVGCDPETLLPVPLGAINTRVVVVADGLGGTAAHAFTELTPIVAPQSYIGTGAISLKAPDTYKSGTIYMAYGEPGYMGLVRLEDGRTDIAGAFHPDFLRRSGSVANTASELLHGCNLPVPDDLSSLPWKGTVALTRKRSKLAAERIFVIGDSAGYVEPFTGEGIAWALASAEAVVPLAQRAIQRWTPSLCAEWEREHRLVVGRPQRTTRIVATVLRHKKMAQALGRLIDFAPPVSSLLVNFVVANNSKESVR
jgi:menaquinone-9 beta-reductase